MHRLWALACGAAIGLIGGPAWAEEKVEDSFRARLDAMVAQKGGLQSDEVAKRAVSTSYSVRQRADELVAAEAAVKQALVAYLPRLQGTGRYTRLSPITAPVLGNLVVAPSSPAGPLPMNAQLVNVPFSIAPILDNTLVQGSLTIPLLDYVLRIPGVHESASRARDAAKYNEAASRLQVASDARVAYYNWVRARLQTVVAEQALIQAKQHLESAENLFNAGATSKADVLRTQALVASSELFVARAKDLEAVLEDQLRTAMHDTPEARYEIGEDLRVSLEPMPIAAAQVLFDEAWTARFEIKVLEESVNAERAQAKAARGGYLPQVAAFGDVIYGNPNPRFFPPKQEYDATWDVGLQLSWAPNDLLSSIEAVDQAEARAKSLEDQMGQVKDALRIEVMQSLEAVREADLNVKTTAQGLDAAEESYRVRRELYQNDRATSVELTDAETDLTQARLNAVTARIDQRASRVRLSHATGQDIERR
jgi:outer membrane protein TolC